MRKTIDVINKNKLIFLTFLIVYICLFILTNNSFYAPDEFNFSNIPWTSQRIMSAKDILIAQKMLYQNTTGRILAHSIIYTLLFLDMHLFDIINGFVFILFILMVGKATGNKNTKIGVALTLLMSTLLIPMFGEKFIWLSGSVNYLWMTTMMLIFMYEMYTYIIKGKKLGKYEKWLLVILAFCTGWSQENATFTTGMFIIILYLSNIKKIFSGTKKEIWYKIGIVLSFGIGALGLIIAPGNFNRLNEGNSLFYIDNFIRNIKREKYILILFVIICVIMLLNKESREKLKKQLLYFVLPAGIALLPMLIIRDFAPRSMFPFEACLFVTIIDSVFYIEQKIPNKVKNIIAIALVFVTIIPLIQLSYKYIKYVKPYKELVENEINTAVINGKTEAVVSTFQDIDKIPLHYDMVNPYPQLLDTSVINIYMGHYYKMNSIWGTTQDKAIVVIELQNSDNLDDYCLVEKNNESNIISTRIQGDTKTDRVIFEINKQDLDKVEIETKNKTNIKNISLKTIEEIKDIKLDVIERRE